jgi:ParB/RepB/Spo0J family partition protein
MPLASTTKQSDLERIDRVGDLALNFGWSVVALVKAADWLIDSERTELDEFLDVCDSQVSSKEPIPEIFWRLVKLNGNVLKQFRNENDAKLLAMALMPTVDAFCEWIAERGAPSSDESIEWILSELPLEYSSFVGTMFAETVPGVGTSIWFGRKADQLPALTGQTAVAAARLLFGVEVKSPPTMAEPVKGKDKQPKLVAKKEKPASAKVAGSRSETDRATKKPPIARPKASLEIIDIDCIESDPENDRKTFDKTKLEELAESIRKHGILQPLLLRPQSGKNAFVSFVIVAGERRWRAAKIAGLKEVPAQISDREGLQVSLARLDENLKRVDLSPIEKAQGLKRLMDTHGLTQREVGEAVGVQQGQVSNMLRLLNLPESLQKRVVNQELAPTLVRPLLPFADIPAIVKEVDSRIESALKDETEITASYFEAWVDQAIEKCTRSMRQNPDYRKPTKAYRCFGTITKEQEKELDLREVDGSPRAFNVAAFDALNKEPMKKKLEAYKKKHAVHGRGADIAPAKEKPLKEYSEYRVANEIRESMMPALLTALQKDSPESNRVLLTLAVHGCFSQLVGHCDNKAVKIFGLINSDIRQTWSILRKSASKCLKHSRLSVAEITTFGNSMKLDLVGDWKPTKELLSSFTMTGLQQVARAIDVNETLTEPKLRDAILKAWPAGYVPTFLHSLFGIKAATKKKAKAA